MWNGADINGYIDLASIFVVVGGVLAATLASFPMSALKNLLKVIPLAFKSPKSEIDKDIKLILDLANIARREGFLPLEEAVANLDEPFLKKGIMLVSDGSNSDFVRNVMETDISFMQERHSTSQAILLQMSSFAPAFGMIGTLIGLVNMLGNLSDMASLGPNMAVALVTTFYGVILANLLFTPMAKKLKQLSDVESLRKEIMLEGILSIQELENPRIIEEKLQSFLSNTTVKQMKSNSASDGGEK
jgi:chemotaxis protein MotA